ncbi:MAG: oxidoreductase [Gammaproteobacteria bacterium]|jgi:NADPH2 dehydrogenase|nr:oxidoreductase [Gammaproteobacteria bacterium]NCF82694.1 oxidoreductase [Pseudomonadota bacterium]
MSALFTPIDLRGLRLDNRIVVSPMCQYSAHDGNVGDWHLMHLGQFSVSGAGMLIVEMTNVEARGRISPNCVGLYNDDNERALARVLAFCRQHSKMGITVQLAHAGRKASTLPPWQGRKALVAGEGGWQTVSASAIRSSDESPPPSALTGQEIADLVDAFAAAARRAHRAGFDAVELHGAHGYLLHQFLSPVSNQRDDHYGGSLENRMRFPLEVFDAVRAEWPDDKPLGMRISAVDYLDGGWRIEDSVALGQRLAERRCDWIDVSSGGIAAGEIIAAGPGYQVPFAEQIRRETGLTTMAVGMITEARQAEAIVASGQADMVALARGMLYDPRWAWHAAAELGAEVTYPNQYLRCQPRQ